MEHLVQFNETLWGCAIRTEFYVVSDETWRDIRIVEPFEWRCDGDCSDATLCCEFSKIGPTKYSIRYLGPVTPEDKKSVFFKCITKGEIDDSVLDQVYDRAEELWKKGDTELLTKKHLEWVSK